MEAERKEQEKRYAKLIAKVWCDEAFKERLMADPQAVLSAEVISVPDRVKVTVVDQMDTHQYLVIPQKPVDMSMDEVEPRLAAKYCNGGRNAASVGCLSVCG